MAAQAIRLVKQSDDINILRNQLDLCPSVTGKLRHIVEDYLTEEEIYTLDDVTEDIKDDYRSYINSMVNISESQKKYYKNLLEQVQLAYFLPQYPELEKQVDEVIKERAIKNKVLLLLIQQGIRDTAEINYEVRYRYEKYLKKTIAASKVSEYLKALDLLKLKSIEKENMNRLRKNRDLKYRNEKIFLLYHPDYTIAMTFYYIRDKEELLFDFSLPSSGKVKRQIFQMLNYVLDEKENWHDRRERFLIPLKRFYLYCVEQNIMDIEQITERQVNAFRTSMEGHVGTKTNIYMQIVDNIRKYLFLSAKDTNWEANAWYLERFHFDEGRTNPAREIKRFVFGYVENEHNRILFKKYMQYQIGISAKSALQTIRCQYYGISQFMKYCDDNYINAIEITAKEIENYIKRVDSKNIKAESFNNLIISVARFYNYLVSKRLLENVPLPFEYFLKSVIENHNNRAVSEMNQQEILNVLKDAPYHLRLMYLNLWAIGLRINEVCSIKGNAYYWDGKDAWFRIYQNKMKSEKNVPIPKMLYELMVAYIKENNIKSDDYVFQNKHGGAYDAGTFCKRMKKFLKEKGIENYDFKSHDFRHTVSTYLYSHGASIEVIRDYLGHKDSSMTKKYLDYIPNMIDRANEDYFKQNENKLRVTN